MSGLISYLGNSFTLWAASSGENSASDINLEGISVFEIHFVVLFGDDSLLC